VEAAAEATRESSFVEEVEVSWIFHESSGLGKAEGQHLDLGVQVEPKEDARV